MKFTNDTTSIIALGGLGEVGKNMYLMCHNDEIIIIDAGVMFPEDDLLGIDYVIQDITFLKQNESKIKGLIITHGHEDHIGGIPFLLQSVHIPKIYCSQIANDLITRKLEERRINYKDIEIIDNTSTVRTKHFTVNFMNVTHSIPGSYGLIVNTPQGVIVTTGDFKFDMTPIGPMADLHKLAEAGSKGVRLLMSDSTNALVEGYSKSESVVDTALGDIFSKHLGRIIIATFASNIYRLKHIIETCRENNRKIVVFGRSMENAVNIAIKNKLIGDESIFIDSNAANSLKKNEVCILCTGSQGEALAALSRIANGTFKQINLMNDDLVIFSSSPIPGNAGSINQVINKLYLKGVRVYTNENETDIHTSGHARIEDLKLMLRLAKPEYFMPMHGEYRMLKNHADIGKSCDIKEENIFIMKNGDVLTLYNDRIEKSGTVQAGDIYVDGSRIGDIGSAVIKDRKFMSKDGILVTILNIDPVKRKLLIKPNITTRGFILVNENMELIEKIENKVTTIVENALSNQSYNYLDLKNQIILELLPFLNELTGRRPIILPVIMTLKNPQ